MDRYPYFKYTILLGATRALAHIGIHFTHRVFGLSVDGLVKVSNWALGAVALVAFKPSGDLA